MMERKDIDRTTVITQTARAGSSDLYATMPWVARLNPKADRPICEGWKYGANKPCKAKANVIYVDLQNVTHYLCGAHCHDRYTSSFGFSSEGPEGARVQKFFDKNVEWSERAKADIEVWNAQVDALNSPLDVI
jgi:hypothetical protein